jgi:hypothetical protein
VITISSHVYFVFWSRTPMVGRRPERDQDGDHDEVSPSTDLKNRPEIGRVGRELRDAQQVVAEREGSGTATQQQEGAEDHDGAQRPSRFPVTASVTSTMNRCRCTIDGT